MQRVTLCVCVWIGLIGMANGGAAATPDVVLYATDAVTLRGNWARQSDASAAAGRSLASADNGWSMTGTPLATPADYAEFTFSAPSSTRFHVWLRLRAAGNSKFNDSVYAQFSDAIDSTGSPIHRVGTTNGLAVNLQNCNGCALSGWGWMDGAYWLTQQSTVSFAAGGTHTLRIQTREDGVQLDQIVLSAEGDVASAPGQSMNDQTIVPKPPTASAGSTPFAGTPAAIPGLIRVSDFDEGGEGLAYHDSTSGNSGGAYRQTDVDLEPSTDGGVNVGWIAAGEWL